MGRRDRIHYAEADKALMWERWRQGESLNAIGRPKTSDTALVGNPTGLSRNGLHKILMRQAVNRAIRHQRQDR